MPSRSLNRRRFDVAADGHTGNCGRVAVFNGCNAALGQTGTFGQKRPVVGIYGKQAFNNVKYTNLQSAPASPSPLATLPLGQAGAR